MKLLFFLKKLYIIISYILFYNIQAPNCQEKKCGVDFFVSLEKGFCSEDFFFHQMIFRCFVQLFLTTGKVAVGSDMLGAHTLAISRNGRLYSPKLKQ